MKWEDYKIEFEFDGSWRDIYVLNTTVSDWQLLFDFLHSDTYKYSCTINEEKTILPTFAKEVFDSDYEFKPLLQVDVELVILNCHFFTEDEIEFDIDPREVKSEQQAEAIFTFMRQIGKALNKEVILTPESIQNMPIFKFLPSNGEIQYIAYNI